MVILSRPGAMQTTRLKKGLSLRKLSELSKVSYSAISRIENQANRFVTPGVAGKICTALQSEFDDLFYLSERTESISNRKEAR